jgi:putative ABC transport system substrate-binding protein
VTRVAVLRDAAVSFGPAQFGVIQAVAPSVRVEVNPINMRDAGEIERAIAAFAGSPNGGLILTAGAAALLHHDLIITHWRLGTSCPRSIRTDTSSPPAA